jgi:hypothetical protein
MRVLILIMCLFLFLATGFDDFTFSTTPDSMRLHHTRGVDNAVQGYDDNHTQNQENQHEIQDCCHMHNYVLTGVLDASTDIVKKCMALGPSDALYSSDLSLLYRPPIV